MLPVLTLSHRRDKVMRIERVGQRALEDLQPGRVCVGVGALFDFDELKIVNHCLTSGQHLGSTLLVFDAPFLITIGFDFEAPVVFYLVDLLLPLLAHSCKRLPLLISPPQRIRFLLFFDLIGLDALTFALFDTCLLLALALFYLGPSLHITTLFPLHASKLKEHRLFLANSLARCCSTICHGTRVLGTLVCSIRMLKHAPNLSQVQSVKLASRRRWPSFPGPGILRGGGTMTFQSLVPGAVGVNCDTVRVQLS
mmetsp:Transcript_16849/g.27055  ORF Transcript_16849/g.27055 Transcript_16849/m.27055 type:complete len:253 (-) Transcript_16849:811-1569(-)